MYNALSLGFRIFGGFGLSAIFAGASLFISWALYYFTDYLAPPWAFIVLWFAAMGLSAGAGTAMAWLGSGVSERLRSPTTIIWLALGLAGAWAAFYYKTQIDPNPAPFSSREVSSTAILWAVVAPNIAAAAWGTLRHVRTGTA